MTLTHLMTAARPNPHTGVIASGVVAAVASVEPNTRGAPGAVCSASQSTAARDALLMRLILAALAPTRHRPCGRGADFVTAVAKLYPVCQHRLHSATTSAPDAGRPVPASERGAKECGEQDANPAQSCNPHSPGQCRRSAPAGQLFNGRNAQVDARGEVETGSITVLPDGPVTARASRAGDGGSSPHSHTREIDTRPSSICKEGAMTY